jgi:hypothetical protein
MLRTLLTAAAAFVAASTSAASAKVHADFENLGTPGPSVGYYPSDTAIYEPYPADCFYVTRKTRVNVGGIWKIRYVNKLVCE